MKCEEHGEVEPVMKSAPNLLHLGPFLPCCPVCNKLLPRPDRPVEELTDES
jgi:hypothetical protein